MIVIDGNLAKNFATDENQMDTDEDKSDITILKYTDDF
jgi:hypothetical protein